jgi:hypothetical protein
LKFKIPLSLSEKRDKNNRQMAAGDDAGPDLTFMKEGMIPYENHN